MTASSLSPQELRLQDIRPRDASLRDLGPRDLTSDDDRRSRWNVVFGRIFDLATWTLLIVALLV